MDRTENVPLSINKLSGPDYPRISSQSPANDGNKSVALAEHSSAHGHEFFIYLVDTICAFSLLVKKS